MSLLKYFEQPDGARDADSLWWGRVLSGHDDFPFRGQAAPMLTADEHSQKVRDFCDARTRVFDLSQPNDLAQYTEVLDHWGNGWWRIVVHEKVYDAELKNWRVFVAWLEPYGGLVHSPSQRSGTTTAPEGAPNNQRMRHATESRGSAGAGAAASTADAAGDAAGDAERLGDPPQ